jgi:signal transduction histidine kinase
MPSDHPIRILIIGAGTGGKALIDLFSRSPGIEVVGVADRDENAIGLKRARERNIPALNDVARLLSAEAIDLVIDVTGDPGMGKIIARYKRPEVEVLGSRAARLLWKYLRYETQTQSQLLGMEKLATIGAFSAGISHDINNSLYLIMTLAEALEEEKDPETLTEYSRDILETSHKIRAIVEGLAGYSRVFGEKEPGPVVISRALDESLMIAKYATVSYEDLEVVKEYGDPHVSLPGRRQEYLQIFTHLIKNSAQAMEGRGTLRLTVKDEEKAVRVLIADSGPGIPKEHLDKIYSPFFTTKNPEQGTGLGLYVVKTLLNRMGGEIRVESEPGHGTLFEIRVPKFHSL